MGIVKGIFASNISGKVGNVVFRKNGKANVVSQRPANVKNPRTDLQQIQRAYVKSVASAYSVFKKICDHSFEGVTYGARSMNYFNKVNYPLVSSAKKAVLKNASSVIVPVNFIMSKGSISWNVNYKGTGTFAEISDFLDKNKITDLAELKYGQLLTALGIQNGDQLTVINVKELGRNFLSPNGLVTQHPSAMYFSRYVLNNADMETKALVQKTGSANDFELNPAILASDSMIDVEAQIKVANGGAFSVHDSAGADAKNYTAIISRRNADKWLRSDSILFIESKSTNTSCDIDNVLPSYMSSEEPYLNGAKK